jgi:hypothetical protein
MWDFIIKLKSRKMAKKAKKKPNIITITLTNSERMIEVRASVGKLFWIEWGDGQETNHYGQEGIMTLTHRYGFGIDPESITIHGDVTGLYRCPANSIRIDSAVFEELDYTTGRLKHLHLVDCPALKRIFVGENRLSSLDLSHCPALEELKCWENWELKELDMTHNPKLRILSAGMNHPELKIDISMNPLLESLDLDIEFQFDPKNNPLLTRINDDTIEDLVDKGCLEIVDNQK